MISDIKHSAEIWNGGGTFYSLTVNFIVHGSTKTVTGGVEFFFFMLRVLENWPHGG